MAPKRPARRKAKPNLPKTLGEIIRAPDPQSGAMMLSMYLRLENRGQKMRQKEREEIARHLIEKYTTLAESEKPLLLKATPPNQIIAQFIFAPSLFSKSMKARAHHLSN